MMQPLTTSTMALASSSRLVLRPSARPCLPRLLTSQLASRRALHASPSPRSHENPLGLPRNNERRPPSMPRRGSGPPEKRKIPFVRKVVVVSSGKGGVGKSTVSANLAIALSQTASDSTGSNRRVGLLDLDIFGPSIPKLMGLESVGEPELTEGGALLPLTNHGIPCMSMGFLLPPGPDGTSSTSPAVAWRGMMVMKAVQQLLFDVDWRARSGVSSVSHPAASTPSSSSTSAQDEALDVLVIDMPPGTGDVSLSLGQLVKVDAALIVSTPQQVALLDARKGISMFDKVGIPIVGMVLNMEHFLAPDTGKRYPLFGSAEGFERLAREVGTSVVGRVPLEPMVSEMGDRGRPVALLPPSRGKGEHVEARDGGETKEAAEGAEAVVGQASGDVFRDVAKHVWKELLEREARGGQ